MRKFILITTLVLMSASAHATSLTRGLTLASAESPKLSVAEQVRAISPEQVAKVDV